MSSLATQLAQNASLNTSILVDRSRRKPIPSYLFTGKNVDAHDLETIHAVAINALLSLASLEPKLLRYEDTLFDESAKGTDRTLLSKESGEELDREIDGLLCMLGPWLMETPTGKVLEWLVRRFRIHEFNVDAVLALFLPYHESPHFAKMVTLLSIKPNTAWSFLLSYKTAGQKLPRVSLVTEMLKNSDLTRFVATLLPKSLKKKHTHRTLIAFNAATLYEFVTRSKRLDEGTVACLLPALLAPLQQKKKHMSKDAVLGSIIILAAFSQKCEVSSAALKVIVGAMVSASHVISEDQLVDALVAVCEPQDELEPFDDATLDELLLVSNIQEQLVTSLVWKGSEKVLRPLLGALVARLDEDICEALLETFITASNVPQEIVEHLARRLVRLATEQNTAGGSSDTAQHLLSQIYQRLPEVLRRAADSVSEEEHGDDEAVEQLMLSLNTIRSGRSKLVSGSTSASELLLQASSADGKIRTAAIKKLAESVLNSNDMPAEELESIQTVFVARLQENEPGILEVLYQSPTALGIIFKSNPKAYIDALHASISSSQKMKRTVLRMQLLYLFDQFYGDVEGDIKLDVRDDAFKRTLWPLLLFSKARAKSTELVWEITGEWLSKDTSRSKNVGFGMLRLLDGCPEIVKKANIGEVGEAVEAMNEVNFGLARKIAENIALIVLSESEESSILDAIAMMSAENHHAKLLAYLVVLELISNAAISSSSEPRGRGWHLQLDAGTKTISAMALEQLVGVNDLSQEHLGLKKPQDTSFGKYIVTKPHSRVALHWTQISVAAAVARIPAPDESGYVLDWVASSAKSAQDHCFRYVTLMRTIYDLANASTSLPVLSSAILQLLFLNLKNNSLAFLAGIWCPGPENDLENSRAISLLHAASFLEAHVLEDDGVDFQTILPCLLGALQCDEVDLRRAALECISRVRVLAEKELVSVYRFDTIYGENGRTLQYLDQKDFIRYLDELARHRDHLANDAAYIKVFHQHHLGRVKGEKKKEHEYKHRVICYLMSHANAASSLAVQVKILQSLVSVDERDKAEILLPSIRAMLERDACSTPTQAVSSRSEDFEILTISIFNAASAKFLNDDNDAWDTYLRIVQTYLRTDALPAIQNALVQSLTTGLFTALKQSRQIELCETLLDVGSREQASNSHTKAILSSVLTKVPLIIHLLGILRPAALTSSPRATKRAKTSESPDVTIPRLSLLAEVLGTKDLSGSLDLISHLLDALNTVVQTLSSSLADVAYIEQLLMSAIESAASGVTEVPNIVPSVIRVDVLVEVIRVSDNPQTFHQALLLISSLARFAPESVLRNVMPVFTFMGTNIFHKDDAYSFKVVQKTIDGIVPVMVSALKKDNPQPLNLYVTARDFLKIFTDAAPHIPRHRRNRFYSHLTDVLGAQDFLAPISMLLLEKSSTRASRPSADELQQSMSVPIAVFQDKAPTVQLDAAIEILNEAQRLTNLTATPDSTRTTFTGAGLSDDDHSLSLRTGSALILFIGNALKLPKQPTNTPNRSLSPIITQLLSLSQVQDTESKFDGIAQAARTTLTKLLTSMSVLDFMGSVRETLDSTNAVVQSAALELVGKRLPNVTSKMRIMVTADVQHILRAVKRIFSIHKSGDIVIQALAAVTAVSATLRPGEEALLTDIIPPLLTMLQNPQTVSAALKALSSLSDRLGPRIIPFFRQIITQCIYVLLGKEHALFEDAMSTLQGLLKSIPSFWGVTEISLIVNLYADQYTTSFSTMFQTLSKAMTKKIPSKILIPGLLDLWPTLQLGRNTARISAFFETLRRAIQHCDRPTVLEHLKAIFKTFLDAFEIVKSDNKAETRVIQSFREVTVKLNETAFKPLFRRLHDWAFTGNSDNERKTTFNHLYLCLLDYFKDLMVPYASFLLGPFTDLLKEFKQQDKVHFPLWCSTIEVLTKTLSYDNSGFWRDDKLRQVLGGLSDQVEACARLNFVDGRGKLRDCLVAFLDSVTDDSHAKALNLNILMHTRSEDVQVRILALSCTETLWRAHSGKLLGFVTETATFIAECGEDENDLVVKESFKLKDAVESVAGKIDGL